MDKNVRQLKTKIRIKMDKGLGPSVFHDTSDKEHFVSVTSSKGALVPDTTILARNVVMVIGVAMRVLRFARDSSVVNK